MRLALEEFMGYCEKNQNSGRRTELHADFDEYQRLIKTIITNPSVIGLREIRKYYLDVGLIEGNQIADWINIVFISKRDDVYICKARISNDPGQGTETLLQNAYNYIKKRFGILPIRIAVRKLHNGPLKFRKIDLDIEDIISLVKL